MNPVDTEKHIRKLELMLYGGVPPRPGADYGSQECGHLDGVSARCPDVHATLGNRESDPEFVVERYVVTSDGKMLVERPGSRG